MAKPANKVSFDPRLLTGIPVVMAVVDAGSFVGAGQALGLSQSGGRQDQRAAGDSVRRWAHRGLFPFGRSPAVVSAMQHHLFIPSFPRIGQSVAGLSRCIDRGEWSC
jgi:hypothetical protein